MQSGFSLGPSALNQLMPMHLLLARDGTIESVGPTLSKLRGDAPLPGAAFLERFEVWRPHGVTSFATFRDRFDQRLHLVLKDDPRTALRGQAVSYGPGHYLLNLSFGIAVIDALNTYDLNASDFAPTDLAVEMLYLVEAKAAAMEEWKRMGQRLSAAKAAAEKAALTDALTGLDNRRSLEAKAETLLETGVQFALLHLDLDHFKAVNDTLGHAAGDALLVHVAQVLRDETRLGDTVVRIGGDEFVIILQGMSHPSRVQPIADRILERLGTPIELREGCAHVSASLGCALSPDYPTPDIEAMLRDADLALYRSKSLGRSQLSFARDGASPHLQ